MTKYMSFTNWRNIIHKYQLHLDLLEFRGQRSTMSRNQNKSGHLSSRRHCDTQHSMNFNWQYLTTIRRDWFLTFILLSLFPKSTVLLYLEYFTVTRTRISQRSTNSCSFHGSSDQDFTTRHRIWNAGWNCSCWQVWSNKQICSIFPDLMLRLL